MTRRSFFASLAALVFTAKLPSRSDYATWNRFGLVTVIDETHEWHRHFGKGATAALHGTEAIITPKQAPAFLRDSLLSRNELSDSFKRAAKSCQALTDAINESYRRS